MTNEALQSYFREQQVSLQWFPVLRAMASEMSAQMPADELLELFSKIGERFAVDTEEHFQDAETLAQLEEALGAGAKMVLLDNMDLPTLREAVRINAGRAILEISGGVTLEGLRALAETGVDRISIGTLTKDVQATDYSMRFDTFAAGAQ